MSKHSHRGQQVLSHVVTHHNTDCEQRVIGHGHTSKKLQKAVGLLSHVAAQIRHFHTQSTTPRDSSQVDGKGLHI